MAGLLFFLWRPFFTSDTPVKGPSSRFQCSKWVVFWGLSSDTEEQSFIKAIGWEFTKLFPFSGHQAKLPLVTPRLGFCGWAGLLVFFCFALSLNECQFLSKEHAPLLSSLPSLEQPAEGNKDSVYYENIQPLEVIALPGIVQLVKLESGTHSNRWNIQGVDEGGEGWSGNNRSCWHLQWTSILCQGWKSAPSSDTARVIILHITTEEKMLSMKLQTPLIIDIFWFQRC